METVMSRPDDAAPTAGREAEIEIRHVGKTFGAGPGLITALLDIEIDIEHGEFVCLLGPSGCGKSTLLNAIAGFSLPTDGSITVKGDEVVSPGRIAAWCFRNMRCFPG